MTLTLEIMTFVQGHDTPWPWILENNCLKYKDPTWLVSLLCQGIPMCNMKALPIANSINALINSRIHLLGVLVTPNK